MFIADIFTLAIGHWTKMKTTTSTVVRQNGIQIATQKRTTFSLNFFSCKRRNKQFNDSNSFTKWNIQTECVCVSSTESHC